MVEQYSEQEEAIATEAVCNSHALIDRATSNAAGRSSNDPAIGGLISLNVRIGSVVSSNLIVETAQKFPATPAALRDAARNLAIAFNTVTLLQVAEAPDRELKQAYESLDAANTALQGECS
ncbi:hypothetical protein [Mycolicibacterium tokaiense]|uniref:Uncharacterized protein n=1 Tax=Mycolicibacterium tokaiense TaxID=39695 RepID=A0A378TKK6_9MYCO|nr:hypothetical protein [Mycolicibacterium tokaiense]BBY85147.1 hypothetical protein MTOK_09290 [Mycolicibacterium tokaiense]STZ60345.1 Uncharacterised protein [Mycolicibacterium tokaiense]